ncbi:MAG: hypothetical protein KBD01_14815 [Acidobacteria bacterium]|nr:hypothetical protein [Acidobacteriota bacterium]
MAARSLARAAFFVGCFWFVLGDTRAWQWKLDFTAESAPALTALHERLAAASCAGAAVVPVEGVRWTAELFELAIETGRIYVCPPVDGVPVWATFSGRASVSFRPRTSAGRSQLRHWLGSDELRAPVAEAHFFTLRGNDLAAQLGIPLPAGAAPADAPPALPGRGVFRSLGTDLLFSFLNRAERAAGTAFVAFPLESIRSAASAQAYALYAFNPQREFEVTLAVAGHHALTANRDYAFEFRPIAEEHSVEAPFRPQAEVLDYDTAVEAGSGKRSGGARTTVRFRATGSLRALRFVLTPRLAVRSVAFAGHQLPFVQWKLRELGPWLDQHLLVELPEPLRPGGEYTVEVDAEGALIRSVAARHADNVFARRDPLRALFVDGHARLVLEEDDWYPRLDGRGAVPQSVSIGVTGDLQALASGRLVESRADGRRGVYRFRTDGPVSRNAFYIGSFSKTSAAADDLQVETYVDRDDAGAIGDPRLAQVEIANALRVFNRMFCPLGAKVIRVVSTPTYHGRGFPGLLLLSREGGFRIDMAAAHLFRAHEVAHQWWGNLVGVRDWPRDRWIAEGLAEYAAMEYYRIRFEEEKPWRSAIERAWFEPETRAPGTRRLLTGDKVPALEPLSLGGANVYTKGPLVLHMLRYLFRAEHGSDARFWDMLRDVLADFRGRALSAADLAAAAERRLGQPIPWFWEQWLHGAELPRVRWSKQVRQDGSGWVIDIRAEQSGTDYRLAVPVYLHVPGGREASIPLRIGPGVTSLEVRVPERPESVTLNDGFECLADLREAR